MVDHYKTLGVKPSATQEEITKAYKRLARENHPDLHNGDKAKEERFKTISEAYQVLGDASSRKVYDATRAPRNPWAGYQARGPRSQGFGFDAGPGFGQFGEGMDDRFIRNFLRMQQAQKEGVDGLDAEADLWITVEEAHTGTSKEVRVLITDKTLDGRTQRPRTFRVTVPPGTEEGKTLRLQNSGGLGHTTLGGKNGDVLLKIRIHPHEVFTTEGLDVHVQVFLWPWQAVLGCSREVQTLTGPRKLKLPPGIQGGKKLKIKGQGLSKDGSLFVEVRIRIPKDPDEQHRQAYLEMQTWEPEVA